MRRARPLAQATFLKAWQGMTDPCHFLTLPGLFLFLKLSFSLKKHTHSSDTLLEGRHASSPSRHIAGLTN